MTTVAKRITWNKVREKEELQSFIMQVKQEFRQNPKEGERQAKIYYKVKRHIHPGITRGQLRTMEEYQEQKSQHLPLEEEDSPESVNHESTSWPSLAEYYYVPGGSK